MSYTTPIAASSLFVNHPNFLHAKGDMDESGEAASLTVYRSPMVQTTDPMYGPVADVLDKYDHEVLHEETMEDENMMFGKAILTLYKVRFTQRQEEHGPDHARTSSQERVAV